MSSAPQTLTDLRQFLADGYEVEKKNFGIRGVCTDRRPWGYHLGKADIYGQCGKGDKDYSLRYGRDRRGLSNASAGFDIRLPQAKLRALVKYLVQQGKNGYSRAGKTLLVEVIGPDAQGNAKRWARSTNWQPTAARADHEWHAHLSFYRDTEFIDKRPLFAAHLGTDAPEIAEEDEPEDQPLEPEAGESSGGEAIEEQPEDEDVARLADAEDVLSAIGDLVADYFDEG